MLDKIILGGSWESVVSRDDFEVDHSPSPRGSPLKDISNSQPEQPFHITRHNPNKIYKREAIIASWKSLKMEREQALGKKTVLVDAENYQDYYGRNKVKRCISERTANVPKVQKKVKRAYSVLHRYDANEERVVKEYKYKPAPVQELEEKTFYPLQKSQSEPYLTPKTPATKKVKRSITTLLNIKTKLLNIFTPKS